MNVGDALKVMLDVAKNDLLKGALPALASFFTNVSAAPTALNIAIQLTKLQVDLLASLPTVEKDLLSSIATLINEQIANLK